MKIYCYCTFLTVQGEFLVEAALLNQLLVQLHYGHVSGSWQRFCLLYIALDALTTLRVEFQCLQTRPQRSGCWKFFLSAVSVEASRLQSALATVDGSLATQEKGLVGNTNHEVELFLPYEYGGDVSEGTVAGLAILSGSIRAHAYCFSREPLSRAVEDLKADIVKSLRSRLEILYDEVDQNFQNTSSNDMSPQDSNTTDSLLHPLQMMENVVEYRCKLPRRIFVPWLEGVLVCDYMQEGEAFQDLCDRCKELLAMTKPLDQSNVLEPEDVNANLSERSFWDIASRKSDPEVNLRNQLDRHVVTVKALPSRTAFWSFVVLILSCIVAWYLRKSWR